MPCITCKHFEIDDRQKERGDRLRASGNADVARFARIAEAMGNCMYPMEPFAKIIPEAFLKINMPCHASDGEQCVCFEEKTKPNAPR